MYNNNANSRGLRVQTKIEINLRNFGHIDKKNSFGHFSTLQCWAFFGKFGKIDKEQFWSFWYFAIWAILDTSTKKCFGHFGTGLVWSIPVIRVSGDMVGDVQI